MSEQQSTSGKPQKRSEILAIDNVKRIADQLRSERNDAIAMAQVMRERSDKAIALLGEVRDTVNASDDHAELAGRIDEFLAKHNA